MAEGGGVKAGEREGGVKEERGVRGGVTGGCS